MLTDLWQFYTANLNMVATTVGIVGGSISATLALTQAHRSEHQRWSELRWRQANTAREMLNEIFSNPRVRNALTMLDCEGRRYEVSAGRYETVTHADMHDALRGHQKNVRNAFTVKEALVHECFDQLFGALERLEHALGNQREKGDEAPVAAIQLSDIRGPLQYWVKALARHHTEVTVFAKAYGYERALALLRRFPEWECPSNREARPVKSRSNALPRSP